MTPDPWRSSGDLPTRILSERELQEDLIALREAFRNQQVRLQDTQAQLFEVLNSTWWRVGEPLRLMGRRFPPLARVFRFSAWSVGKCFYYGRRGVLGARFLDYVCRSAGSWRFLPRDLAMIGGLRLQTSVPDPALIKLPASDRPVVSIVIPGYGHVDMTLKCLASIAAAPPSAPTEVILAEDGSGDPAVQAFAKVPGLRFINRKKNLGFTLSCNDAAKQAKGDFIFLLNNDTEVMPGAIDALLELFHKRPDAGLVGCRLVYADGRQQEAGGIMWKDGTAWNYGRNDDPGRPEYNYVRETDYISGAAIMVPRLLWEKLAGFDECYAPAYCEDSDLAYRIRKVGKKVYYQPKAWIVHHEGMSHGTDVNQGLKAYQVRNNEKLRERWADVFALQQFETGTRLLRARDRLRGRKIVLIIDHHIPEPDRDAGSRTIMQFIETFLAMGRTVKFWPANMHPSPEYAEALQQMGVEVMYGDWNGSFEKWIKHFGSEIDEVLISRPVIVPLFLPALRRYTKAPVVFYGHDLHFLRMEREAEIFKDASKFSAAQEMKELERRVWLSVDQVLYPSSDEVQTVRMLEPSVKARVVTPYGFKNTTARSHPPGHADIIFVAGFRHSPNVDAAAWYCAEIMPLVRAVRPDARLTLIGSHPARSVQALANGNVKVTGYVTDERLAELYANARVVVAPMRFGAGVKMKVVEALREGVPLVTTDVGAQGLPGLEGIVDVCNEPSAFAAAVIRLLTDDALWQARSQAQAAYVLKHFSCASMQQGLEEAFSSVSRSKYGAAA